MKKLKDVEELYESLKTGDFGLMTSDFNKNSVVFKIFKITYINREFGTIRGDIISAQYYTDSEAGTSAKVLSERNSLILWRNSMNDEVSPLINVTSYYILEDEDTPERVFYKLQKISESMKSVIRSMSIIVSGVIEESAT